MMYSNQPYQKVDDGIGAGLVGGMVVGAAGYAGVATYGSFRGYGNMINKYGKAGAESRVMNKASARVSAWERKTGKTAGMIRQNTIGSAGAANEVTRHIPKGKLKTAIGSGRARAITSAASILGMGAIGAGIDAAND